MLDTPRYYTYCHITYCFMPTYQSYLLKEFSCWANLGRTKQMLHLSKTGLLNIQRSLIANESISTSMKPPCFCCSSLCFPNPPEADNPQLLGVLTDSLKGKRAARIDAGGREVPRTRGFFFRGCMFEKILETPNLLGSTTFFV